MTPADLWFEDLDLDQYEIPPPPAEPEPAKSVILIEPTMPHGIVEAAHKHMAKGCCPRCREAMPEDGRTVIDVAGKQVELCNMRCGVEWTRFNIPRGITSSISVRKVTKSSIADKMRIK